jgi:GTPase SAR1 family protein
MIIKNFKSFNENIESAYDTPNVQSEKSIDAVKKEDVKKSSKKPVEEESEEKSSLSNTLEKCISDAEEIVKLFEKDDEKLIKLTLPVLDLCQTNLNFQNAKAEGKDVLLKTSKDIIKSLIDKLSKEYSNNDPVVSLIENCKKI